MHTVVSASPAATPYTLTMTRCQAEALAAVLVHVSDDAEGGILDDLYTALVADGAEVEDVWSGVEGGKVVVTRDGAR